MTNLTPFPLWSNSPVISFHSSLTYVLQRAGWVQVKDKSVRMCSLLASHKLLRLRKRHSFSGVTQCYRAFWDGGRSLKSFPAMMLSFIQKCKPSLPFCQHISQTYEYHTSLKALLDLFWREKVAQNLLLHWGDAHTSQDSHIHMQITVPGWKQDTHMIL